MPTELEELVEFLHHGNPQLRQLAISSLVGYSATQPSIFKSSNLRPVSDLMMLVKDVPSIAKDAITILINISSDPEVVEKLVSNDDFINTVLTKLTDPTSPLAHDLTHLLPNLTKHTHLATRLVTLPHPTPTATLTTSPLALDHLLALFHLGAGGTHNPTTHYHHLAYALADVAQHPAGRAWLTAPRASDAGRLPLGLVLVFVGHADAVRRWGAVSAVKNACFDVAAHRRLLGGGGRGAGGGGGAHGEAGAEDVLPYLLLRLMGGEEYALDEMECLPEECQMLEAGKRREESAEIVGMILDALLLLTTTREGREVMRRRGVYFVVRELHLAVEDEGVREGCDRLVQMLMRDEPAGEEGAEDVEEGKKKNGKGEETDEDEDDEIVDVV